MNDIAVAGGARARADRQRDDTPASAARLLTSPMRQRAAEFRKTPAEPHSNDGAHSDSAIAARMMSGS
jgi:hypothetical protein